MTYHNANYTTVASGDTDFGFCDKQGRAVGYSWNIQRVTLTPAPADQNWGYRLQEGEGLEQLLLRAGPTRNGKPYGASSGSISIATQADALPIIEKRTEQARKRDSKKFGGAR